jgi:hypothetical protein
MSSVVGAKLEKEMSVATALSSMLVERGGSARPRKVAFAAKVRRVGPEPERAVTTVELPVEGFKPQPSPSTLQVPVSVAGLGDPRASVATAVNGVGAETLTVFGPAGAIARWSKAATS